MPFSFYQIIMTCHKNTILFMTLTFLKIIGIPNSNICLHLIKCLSIVNLFPRAIDFSMDFFILQYNLSINQCIRLHKNVNEF